MGEAWCPIHNAPGYEVSALGRVRSWRVGQKPRILTPTAERYPAVTIRVAGRRRKRHVHRLVLEAFVGPCPRDCQASHLDGNSANNALRNLRWETPQENCGRREGHGALPYGERAGHAKLSSANIPEIMRRRERGETLASIASRFGVGFSAIYKVCAGKTWARAIVQKHKETKS